jgi:hypothetical protein
MYYAMYLSASLNGALSGQSRIQFGHRWHGDSPGLASVLSKNKLYNSVGRGGKQAYWKSSDSGPDKNRGHDRLTVGDGIVQDTQCVGALSTRPSYD